MPNGRIAGDGPGAARVNGPEFTNDVSRTSDELAAPARDAADPASTAELEYRHELKPGKKTDIPEMEAQIERQVNGMNRIIEEEGMTGLKERIKRYRQDPSIEAEGRAYVKELPPAGSRNGEPLAWPHEPDMGVGGGPRDVGPNPVILRNNSILGGNVRRLQRTILNQPDSITKLTWRLILKGIE
jgi:hypothetical protein